MFAVAAFGTGAEAGNESPKAKAIYDAVMQLVSDYDMLNEPKVMAICIDWNAPNRVGYYVHNAFVTYTGRYSSVPVFAEKLANDAKYRCKKWRKAEKIDCTCQMLDSNGKNVLKVPTGE